AVGVQIADPVCDLDELSKIGQLGIKLLDGASGGGRVQQLLLHPLDLFGATLVVIPVAEVDREELLVDTAAVDQLFPVTLESIGPPDQGLVDRVRAGGYAPLEDRERETDGVATFVIQPGSPV